MGGNIASLTLHKGTTEEVSEQTKACIEEAQKTGKVIAGCSNIIMPETPMENVDAMLAAFAA